MKQPRLEFPAPNASIDSLHFNLVDAGQAFADEDLPEFLLRFDDDAGEMIAGCKGEIVFKTAHVSQIWVSETALGQGLGTKLLEAAEAFAKERGCSRLHLETRSSRARALYEKLG